MNEDCPGCEILHNDNMRLSNENHDYRGKLLGQSMMIDDAAKLLNHLEWGGGISLDEICTICGNTIGEHEEDCALMKWLQKRKEMR